MGIFYTLLNGFMEERNETTGLKMGIFYALLNGIERTLLEKIGLN